MVIPTKAMANYYGLTTSILYTIKKLHVPPQRWKIVTLAKKEEKHVITLTE
jgi:hypothetical protein